MQGGSFGKKLESKQLIPESKLTQIISKDDATDIVNNLNTIKDKTNETYKSFDEYFAILKKEGQQCVVDYVKENKNQVYVTDDVIDASKKARAEQIAYNETIRQSTLAFKAASIAKRIFATIGNMAAMWTLSKAIGAVTETIGELVHSEENLRQSASDLGSELSNNSSDIEVYKKKIEELKAVINDSSSSFDEVSQARVDLMAIQDELIEKFGTEKGVIESITSAINDQTDALDELSRRAYFQKKNEFNEKNNGDKVADWLSFGNTSDDRIQSNMDKMVSTMRYSFYELETTGNEVLDNLIAKSYGLNIAEDMYGDGKHFQVYGTLDEIQDKLYGIQELSQDFDLSTGFENSFTTISNDVDDALAKFRNLYDQYVLYEKILTDNPDNQYDEQFDLINKAKEAYNEAVKSGNEENIKTSADEYAKTLQSAIDLAMGNYDYDVADYFKAMYPELQQMFGEWQFSLNFEPNTDGLQDKVADALDSIDGVSDGTTSFSAEDIENFNPNVATQEQIDAYGELTNVAETYGLTVKQLIALLQTMGLIQSESYQQLVDTFGQDNVDKLSPEDLEITYTIKNVGNMTFEQLQVEIQRSKELADKNSISTFEDAWANSFTSEDDKVKELGDTLLGLAEKGRLTKEIFEEADSTAGDYFKNLGISADEAVAKINKLVDESSQLSSMSSQLSSMAEALGTKQENGFVEADTLAGFDVEVRGLDSWDRFQEVLGSTTSSYEECQEAANALATEWVNSSDFLAQLTEQNEEYYKTQLESMGIENYEEVISYAHALNEAKEVLSQSSLELGNATYDEIEALIAEGQYSELTANMILTLYDAKIAEQAATLDTSTDCANLIALANDTDRTSQSIQLLIQLMDIYSGLESGAYNGNRLLREEALAEVNRIKKELEALANGETDGIDIEPTVKLGNRGKSSAKSAGKSAGKSLKDGLKEELSDLESVISGVTGRIDDQISSINEQKSAALESIDAQKEALEEAKDAAVEALEAERDARLEVIETQKEQLEEQIKLIDKQIKQKQDEIDRINEVAEAIAREISLQEKQYALEQKRNQRTKLVYTESSGMIYRPDEQGIRKAKEEVDDAKRQIEIANIQKEIDLLEDQKDLLNEQITLLDEQADAVNKYYDEQIAQTEKYYDNLLKNLEKQRKETEAYYESITKSLEQRKEKFQELTEILEKAELSAKLKQLGIDEEALLNGSEEEFEKLKNAYMDIVFQLNKGNDDVLNALRDLSGYEGTAPAVLKESNTKLGTMNDELGNATTKVGNVNSSLDKTASTTSDVATNVSDVNTNIGETVGLVNNEKGAFDELKQTIDLIVEAINQKIQAIEAERSAVSNAVGIEMADFQLLINKIQEVKEKLDEVNNTVTTMDRQPIDNLANAFQLLYAKVLLVSNLLGVGVEGESAVSGISGAIQALNEISLEEGIIAQFNNLKTAIDQVTAAISGGGGESSEGEGSGGGSGSSGGKQGNAGGKGSQGKGESGGGGNSLTGAIESMGETAKEVIGEPDAEGDGTVIGEFGSMETAVNDVRDAIGTEGSEGQGGGSGGETDDTLVGSIEYLGDKTDEEMGESGGDGIIGRFEEFEGVIEEAKDHVQSINKGLDEIDGKEVECTIKVKIETSGGGLPAGIGAGMNLGSATYEAKYLGNAHVEGTALASGNWAVQSNENNALVGEVGCEIIVRNGRFFTVGEAGPEMFPIKKGDIVFNHEQSVELLKNGHTSGRGKAYADGTVGGGKALINGKIHEPISLAEYIQTLRERSGNHSKQTNNGQINPNGKAQEKLENTVANVDYDLKELLKPTHIVAENMKRFVGMDANGGNTNNINNVVNNNRNVQQPVVHQQFNITMPNVTDSTTATSLMNDLQSLATKKYQVNW